MKKLFFTIAIALGTFNLFSQKLNTFGTEFIFPNIQQRGLNIETGPSPATITIFDFGTLGSQVINLPADTAISMALLPFTSPSYTRFVQGNLFAQLASTRITSTAPIAVRYRSADGAAGGMSSLLPVSELGYDYTVQTHKIEHFINLNFHNMLPHIVITATQNNTPITIIPSHNTDNGWLAGSTNVITLNRGQSYPIQGIDCGVFASTFRPACNPTLATSLNNLSGTRIYTDTCKKIKVTFYLQSSYIGGGRYIPGNCCSESSIETVLPEEKIGKTYFVVPEMHVRQGDLFKIMALENNTHVFIDNSFVRTLNKNEQLDTISKVPLKISSNNDIHIAQIFMAWGNESITTVPRWNDTTDPEFVYPYPIQYQSTFFNFAHPTWPYSSPNPYAHHLTIITKTSNTGNITLDGTAIATTRFQPFVADPTMSWAYFNVTDGFHRVKATSGSFQAIMSRNQNQGSQCYYSAIDTNVFYQNLPAMLDTCVSDTITLHGDTMADSYLWSTGDTTQSIRVFSPGTYWVHNIKCSDTITDTFNIDSYLYAFTTADICDGASYNFRGAIITIPGIYSDTTTNPSGCDSIITLTLSLKNNPDTATINSHVCQGDSIIINNISYNNSGTFYDTLQNISGCDSVALTIIITKSDPPILIALSDTFCQNDTVYFNGVPITTQGTFYDTLRGKNNCDSIFYTLETIIINAYTDSIYRSICDNQTYLFDGNQLSVAGTYTRTSSSPSGCDSTQYLFLTVNPTHYYYLDTSICIYDSVIILNQVINKDGLNTFNLFTRDGCDSIIAINVINNCPDNIFVPSSFTPNGDGLNDEFIPVLPDSIENYELMIFNRWGEIIFSTEDKEEGWDGNHNGVPVPNDIFIWKIRYSSIIDTKSIIGHVQVLK